MNKSLVLLDKRIYQLREVYALCIRYVTMYTSVYIPVTCQFVY